MKHAPHDLIATVDGDVFLVHLEPSGKAGNESYVSTVTYFINDDPVSREDFAVALSVVNSRRDALK